ncbi:MAG: type II toxin-antitoxin system HicB family antitoxin [Candidatus Marsarchaeota archaeon]|jgi:predicted RNase H-like HicB family nuclease|nr:type II toxin-antitoxin system HicB family antitoxin [Candidatus Marsarchaeota archaeon]
MAGFIKVWTEDNHYIAEIPSLHIVDQAESISELKKNLKEAVELTVESLVKDDLGLKGKKAKDAIDLLSKPLVASLEILSQKNGRAVFDTAKA